MDIKIVQITMDACWDDRTKWEISNEKIRCVFLNKREVLSRFFGKSNISKYASTYKTRSYNFWTMNAMCTFMYLFVVYFSFAPVISASIHRYVNYFDIQVLRMVTDTETLTSTLHHNIFTYLDNVFSATFILSDFNPYLLSYTIYCIQYGRRKGRALDRLA